MLFSPAGEAFEVRRWATAFIVAAAHQLAIASATERPSTGRRASDLLVARGVAGHHRGGGASKRSCADRPFSLGAWRAGLESMFVRSAVWPRPTFWCASRQMVAVLSRTPSRSECTNAAAIGPSGCTTTLRLTGSTICTDTLGKEPNGSLPKYATTQPFRTASALRLTRSRPAHPR